VFAGRVNGIADFLRLGGIGPAGAVLERTGKAAGYGTDIMLEGIMEGRLPTKTDLTMFYQAAGSITATGRNAMTVLLYDSTMGKGILSRKGTLQTDQMLNNKEKFWLALGFPLRDVQEVRDFKEWEARQSEAFNVVVDMIMDMVRQGDITYSDTQSLDALYKKSLILSRFIDDLTPHYRNELSKRLAEEIDNINSSELDKIGADRFDKIDTREMGGFNQLMGQHQKDIENYIKEMEKAYGN
jgi:hypothetical protein